jgi:hypothetical protein
MYNRHLHLSAPVQVEANATLSSTDFRLPTISTGRPTPRRPFRIFFAPIDYALRSRATLISHT